MKDQAVLDLISSSFSSTLSSPRFGENLQTVKTHLYNRSFSEAFPTAKPEDDTVDNESQTLLETYVVRWVPTRVLCYARIFERIASFLPEELRAVCIGAGCGSESLAFRAAFNRTLKLHVVDSCAGWEPILSKLTEKGNTVLSGAVVEFHHADIVTDYSQFKEILLTTHLVTLMFTLNELITAQGKVPATKFLVELIKMIPQGSMILIVDSPTYSVVEIGGKHFPVSFLVSRLKGLEEIWKVESEWFRLDSDLKYPIPLENMRYFGMLMRKI